MYKVKRVNIEGVQKAIVQEGPISVAVGPESFIKKSLKLYRGP